MLVNEVHASTSMTPKKATSVQLLTDAEFHQELLLVHVEHLSL